MCPQRNLFEVCSGFPGGGHCSRGVQKYPLTRRYAYAIAWVDKCRRGYRMAQTNLNEHNRDLAYDLLEDIELSRTTVAQQVLKASRLARLVGDDEASEWLGFETRGMADTPSARRHMSRTRRWTDAEEDKGYWGPVADHERQIQVLREELTAASVDSFAGDYLVPVTRDHRKSLRQTSNLIATYTRIMNQVQAMLHDFARRTFYEIEFGSQQQELFEHARAEIDHLLAPAGDALDKIDSIYRRLSEGDREAVSQAMNSCRRLIDLFADEVYPARAGEPIVVNGTDVDVGVDKTQNRINAYVLEHVDSKSRRSRIRRSLSDVYSRVSAGVHDDVTITEARYLFLSTYVLLGEILAEGQAAPTQ